MAKFKGWRFSLELGSTGLALWVPNPLPSPQYFLLRIQDNGQGRVVSSCIHHTKPQSSTLGDPEYLWGEGEWGGP
jgi:hypothetical protein